MIKIEKTSPKKHPPKAKVPHKYNEVPDREKCSKVQPFLTEDCIKEKY